VLEEVVNIEQMLNLMSLSAKTLTLERKEG